MSKDMQPAVQLEITVPRIHLPLIHEQAASLDVQREAHNNLIENTNAAYTVEVIVSPLPTLQQGRLASATQLEDTGYAARNGQFRLFRTQKVAADGQRWLLQLLRHWITGNAQQTPARARVDDELVFSINYQQTDKAPAVEIIPGLQQITIVLDQEQIPLSCRVDGVQI